MSIRFNPLDHPAILPPDFYASLATAWIQHLPFANLLIELARPKILVELGTHTGVSYCAFCEAVKIFQVDTRCFAIDTWEGDSHVGHYSKEILTQLRAYHDPRYGSFSRLIQSTFDNALAQFADASIDVLHIDGNHTYEAVKHDFETWKPKISDAGVVLFHDTNNKTGDFGVYRLWAEIEKEYPSFQFLFGSGLGVLAVGRNAPREIIEFLSDASANAAAVNRIFNTFGERYLMMACSNYIANTLLAQNEMLNAWKLQANIPVMPTQSARSMIESNPFGFADQIARDSHALVAENLRLRQALNSKNDGDPGVH
jgi:hypothetical protein